MTIGNPNLTTGGLGTEVSPSGSNVTDQGIIVAGAKLMGIVNIGSGNLIITCMASITSPNAPQPATWTIVPGLAFNPPITPGSKFPQFEYDARATEAIIYVEY